LKRYFNGKILYSEFMAKRYLKQPTEPLRVQADKRIKDLTREMLATGFQGRKLAEAVEVWTRMLRSENIVIWFGLAGAMVPAGMRRIVSYLIRRRMVDVVVSTGANLYHDFAEALGVKHYIGSHLADDVKLRKAKVDRIYDVFADEAKYYKIDNIIEQKFTPLLKDNYPYSSREVLSLLGSFLSKYGRAKDSILLEAYRSGVPIFCPAFGDSALGFSLMFANRKRKEGIRRLRVDYLQDVDESSRITEKAKLCGAVFVGGGVPKNFIQQTAVIAGYQTRHDRSLSYAVQLTTDLPIWGGLSGATLQEAKSWGKYKPDARVACCYSDATITLPIISQTLSEKFRKLKRAVPVFKWGNDGNVKVKYRNASL